MVSNIPAGRLWLVTSRLGTRKSLTFFYSAQRKVLSTWYVRLRSVALAVTPDTLVMVPAKSLAMAYGYLVYGQGGLAINLATDRCLQHPCAAVAAVIQVPVQECKVCIPFHYLPFGRVGCIPFYYLPFGRAGCIPFYYLPFGRAGCIPFYYLPFGRAEGIPFHHHQRYEYAGCIPPPPPLLEPPARDGQRYSKMYRLKRHRYAIFEKKIV